MKAPKVTVLMSVYNGEKYLREAIDSILNQTFEDFEFLIINDCSTDRTMEILQSYHDHRIKIINNEKNIGLTKSLNKGLKIARGEYIARQDADDVSAPDRLKKEIDFLGAHRDYAVVGTFVKVLNDDSKVIRLPKGLIEDFQIRDFFKRSNCLTHGSTMLRKKCLLEVGFYDESIARAQDYDLWLRLSEKYRLANIPEYLYMWRMHTESIEARFRDEQKISVVLAMVKNNILDVEQATRLFIEIIAENCVPRSKLLNMGLQLINLLTLNRLAPSIMYKVIYKIRFSKRVCDILNDFKMKKISFENAKLKLKDIANRRLTWVFR
jgi:glycosyltransferase involved in cell wall biosynthesis